MPKLCSDTQFQKTFRFRFSALHFLFRASACLRMDAWMSRLFRSENVSFSFFCSSFLVSSLCLFTHGCLDVTLDPDCVIGRNMGASHSCGIGSKILLSASNEEQKASHDFLEQDR